MSDNWVSRTFRAESGAGGREHTITTTTYFEDAVDVLSCRVVVNAGFSETTHHVVNRTDDVQHFIFRDLSITIDVIQVEHPLQLLRKRASSQQRETNHKLLRPNSTSPHRFQNSRTWRHRHITQSNRVTVSLIYSRKLQADGSSYSDVIVLQVEFTQGGLKYCFHCLKNKWWLLYSCYNTGGNL